MLNHNKIKKIQHIKQKNLFMIKDNRITDQKINEIKYVQKDEFKLDYYIGLKSINSKN